MPSKDDFDSNDKGYLFGHFVLTICMKHISKINRTFRFGHLKHIEHLHKQMYHEMHCHSFEISRLSMFISS